MSYTSIKAMNLNREWLLILIIIIIFLTLDLSTKKYAKKNKNVSRHFFGGRIQFIYVKNFGIAFNKMSGKKNLILIINLFLFFYLGHLLYTDMDNFLAYSLILSGGLGNFIDRLKNGYVTDFIYFKIDKWPVFNIADFEVFLGIIIILIKK